MGDMFGFEGELLKSTAKRRNDILWTEHVLRHFTLGIIARQEHVKHVPWTPLEEGFTAHFWADTTINIPKYPFQMHNGLILMPTTDTIFPC